MISLRQRLVDGPTVLGTWVNTPSPELVETLGDVGFDCVFLDLEHGEYGTVRSPTCCVQPVPRGASASSARPRLGARGRRRSRRRRRRRARSRASAAWTTLRRSSPRRTTRRSEPRRRADDTRRPATGRPVRRLPGAHRGRRRGRSADRRARRPRCPRRDPRQPHLDLAFIGPFDLSQHLGVPGETSHPSVVEAMTGIVERAEARGLATGTWAPTAAAARPWIAAGVRLVTVASSTALFTGAASASIAELRS